MEAVSPILRTRHKNIKGEFRARYLPFKPFSTETPSEGAPHLRTEPVKGEVRRGQIGLTDAYIRTRSPQVQQVIRAEQDLARPYYNTVVTSKAERRRLEQQIIDEQRPIRLTKAEADQLFNAASQNTEPKLSLKDQLEVVKQNERAASEALKPIIARIKQLAVTLKADEPNDALPVIYPYSANEDITGSAKVVASRPGRKTLYDYGQRIELLNKRRVRQNKAELILRAFPKGEILIPIFRIIDQTSGQN